MTTSLTSFSDRMLLYIRPTGVVSFINTFSKYNPKYPHERNTCMCNVTLSKPSHNPKIWYEHLHSTSYHFQLCQLAIAL